MHGTTEARVRWPLGLRWMGTTLGLAPACGGYGSGDQGGITHTLAFGNTTVPARYWNELVVLADGVDHLHVLPPARA